jgi:ABC-type sugar transport system ATPase subunit
MEVLIEGLRFARDGRVVLDIPTLRFRGDRTTVVLGPNGAGKTTLLRLIAGLERPGAGRILVGGAPVSADVRMRQNVAYVFQEHVFLRRSVRENLDLGLRMRKIGRDERRARIEDAARLLGISHLLDRRADRLSGGEGRRAGLARAVCLKAPLVLLDEPLAGVDPATYARLLDELPQVLQAFTATAVLVTHDREEALRLGQDLVVIADGRVKAAGEKRDVVRNPAGVAVAEALGHTVLKTEGRPVAIPRGALQLGPGPVPFSLLVEDVVDLGDHHEIVGCIGTARVRVTAPARAGLPRRGERVVVHADRVWQLPQ